MHWYVDMFSDTRHQISIAILANNSFDLHPLQNRLVQNGQIYYETWFWVLSF
jgi:hypothetical protein